MPISEVMDSVNQLSVFGKASHPYAGLVFSTIDKKLRAEENLNEIQGAFVVAVGEYGPGYNAGIKNNDVILEINREKLSERNELDKVLRKYKAGDTVLVKLSRNGEIIETPLLLGEYR